MKELLELAIQLVEQAGDITLDYFRENLDVHIKQDQSPVTEADRRAEAFLREELEKRFPDDGILGEEFGEKESKSGMRWILDPIDGTKSFIRGIPLYGTLLALESEGESLIGVVRYPPRKVTLSAMCGNGCYCNGEICRVSATSELKQSSLMTTSFGDIMTRWGEQALIDLLKSTGLQRTWGDCYSYLLVATGKADIALDSSMHMWDVAPLIPIIQEAGGTITNIHGEISLDIINTVATNGLIHDDFLRVLQNAMKQ